MTRATVLSSLLLGAATLALGACGGDDAADTSTIPETMVPTATPTPSPTPTPTMPAATPTPTAPVYVTEGATVIVANASSINGAAGRLSDRLGAVGFVMGEPTNSSEMLSTTKVYFNASVDGAQAVADSIVAALGGGEIVAEPLPTPAPLTDPETIGDATVLVAMGSDVADKTLGQLQGLEPDTTTPDSTADTTDDSADASTESTTG